MSNFRNTLTHGEFMTDTLATELVALFQVPSNYEVWCTCDFMNFSEQHFI